MKALASLAEDSPDLVLPPPQGAPVDNRPRPPPYRTRPLFMEFVAGQVPAGLAIPTGLGKTACVLVALLARPVNPELPRRNLYIVDRRAIVDQAGACIRGWIDRIEALPALAGAFRACAAFPGRWPVALGVLRGGLAVIVGTVDLVGSRLMFAGYGAGRSRRAMDAGLLGHDALIVLDEADHAPAMGELLRAVMELHVGPELQVMVLSALGGGDPAPC